MNRAIWKYPLLQTLSPQNIFTKKGAILRCVHALGYDLCIWLEIDETEIEEETRMVIVAGTEERILADTVYLGSSITGDYVRHVYGKQEDWTLSKSKGER